MWRRDGEKRRKRTRKGEEGERKRDRRERDTHHCCAATAGFATSRPIASTRTDNRTPLTRA